MPTITLPAEFDRAAIVSTNRLLIRATGGEADELGSLAFWELTASAPNMGDADVATKTPRIALIEFLGGGSFWLLTFDGRLYPEIAYSLQFLGEIGAVVPDPITFNGIDLSAPKVGTEAADLEDIDQPLGQDWQIIDGGDFKLSGGIETVKRLVVDAVLTARGQLSWNPEHGSNLPHKQPRPADLKAEAVRLRNLVLKVPRVESCTVALTWDGTQLVADLDVRTAVGLFQVSQGLTT